MTPDTAATILDLDRLQALSALAVASLWTPGPNNVMLAASGATFGLRRTVPHALGVALGFGAMVFLVALFLGELFRAVPVFATALKYVGAAVMLWLAWRVATAGRAQADKPSRARPFSFVEACAFQWINPKAWTIVMATAATFMTGAAPMLEAAALALVFSAIGLTSSHAWAGAGAALQRWLSTELRLRLFNGAMGALIALYVAMMLLE